MISAALAGGLIDRDAGDDADHRGRDLDVRDPGAGAARRASSAARRAASAGGGAGVPPEERAVPRHHRRLWPRRRADRRHARPARDPVHRASTSNAADRRARPGRRQARLLRRRLARRIPAPLRARDGARAWSSPWIRPTANEAVVERRASLRPDLTLVARARDADHASTLYELGVTDAVPETIEASLQLSEAVLVDLGVPMGSSSPRSTRSATNSARSWPPLARPSGRARYAPRDGREPLRAAAQRASALRRRMGPRIDDQATEWFQSAASAGPMASAPRISRFRGSRRSQSG